MRVTTGLVAVLLLVSTPALSSCVEERGGGVTLPEPPPGPPLELNFDTGYRYGEVLSRVINDGSGSVDLEVASTGSAKIKVDDGPDGSRAVRFPAHTDVPDPPVAVIVAREGRVDQSDGVLAPGSRDFTFGATFSLDADSDGDTPDDGNNLLQRGSYDDPGQFKLQVDGQRPSCRILGDEGDTLVEADTRVIPGEWYTVSCTRTASEVALTLAHYGRSGEEQTWRKVGVTGAIDLGALPLSVGGKVRPDGSPRTSADQFNGVIDDVFLRIE